MMMMEVVVLADGMVTAVDVIAFLWATDEVLLLDHEGHEEPELEWRFHSFLAVVGYCVEQSRDFYSIP